MPTSTARSVRSSSQSISSSARAAGREGLEALAERRLYLLEGHVPTLCSASKPYDKDDANGQQGAGEPESDECLAPVRAVAHRLDDPDADAPRVERANERGDASDAERAESRRPGDGTPKRVATSRFRAHGSMMRVAARPVNARSPATSRPAPPERPILLAVDQEFGEGASLRVAPELAHPVGAAEVGAGWAGPPCLTDEVRR
jgi:hypothetical protein